MYNKLYFLKNTVKLQPLDATCVLYLTLTSQLMHHNDKALLGNLPDF